MNHADHTLYRPAARLLVAALVFAMALVVLVFTLVDLLDSNFGVNTEFLLPSLRIFLLLNALFLLYVVIWRYSTYYQVHSDEITGTTGIIAKSQVRIPIDRISDFGAKRTFWQFFLGVTNVYVDTPGSDRVELILLSLSRGDANAIVIQLTDYRRALSAQAGRTINLNP